MTWRSSPPARSRRPRRRRRWPASRCRSAACAEACPWRTITSSIGLPSYRIAPLETCPFVQYLLCMAASAARIAEVLAGLRASSARLRTGAELERGVVPSGVGALDRALGGGLPRGRITELVGARSSGRMSLVVGALAATQRTGELVALIDAGDAFDPRSAAACGVVLARTLWVRPRDAGARRDQDGRYVSALQAADRVLEAGGF